uniref:Uncharacterized protein n=1 Tax=Aplanochytrium stocchinoi TaxID=215587 RepID=A0A7S3V0I5_9STRA
MAMGRVNSDTANAQDRLSEWLHRDLMNYSDEADMWATSAKKIREEITTRDAILRNWEKARGSVKRNIKDVLDEMRNARTSANGRKMTGFEEIQEETALFGLSRPSQEQMELNDIEKWQMLAKGKKEKNLSISERINSGNNDDLGL